MFALRYSEKARLPENINNEKKFKFKKGPIIDVIND